VVVRALVSLARRAQVLAFACLVEQRVVQDLVLRMGKLARIPKAALSDQQVSFLRRLLYDARRLLVLLVRVVTSKRQVG
jgi:hypothetical protein